MDREIWDSYRPGVINDKIKYWVDLWQDLIDNFNKTSYGLKLANPHLLLTEIMDEIEFNEFKNKENRNYYFIQLNAFIKNDPVIKKDFRGEFELLRKIFNQDRNLYILQVCRNAERNFANTTATLSGQRCYPSL